MSSIDDRSEMHRDSDFLRRIETESQKVIDINDLIQGQVGTAITRYPMMGCALIEGHRRLTWLGQMLGKSEQIPCQIEISIPVGSQIQRQSYGESEIETQPDLDDLLLTHVGRITRIDGHSLFGQIISPQVGNIYDGYFEINRDCDDK